MATLSEQEIERVVHANHYDPFRILGMHAVEIDGEPAVVVRAFLPEAREASVIDTARNEMHPLERIHPDGFFEYVFTGLQNPCPYRLRVTNQEGYTWEFVDPYCFLPVLTEFDRQIFAEGNHHKIYEKLGAHILEVDGVAGVHFAVWAPEAQRVSLVGNFNHWDGRRHPMRVLGSSGIWELFVPGLTQGEVYKYEIKSRAGQIFTKADPYAYFAEIRPATASVVWDISLYDWNDQVWMERRAHTDPLPQPLSTYEVHLGSWMRIPETNDYLTYRDLAHKLVDYVLQEGYTHIELLPVMEHPFDASWGYQVVGYFAPTSRFGTPDDFMYFVDYCHQHGVGIILDWVPAHFPTDPHGLAWFDGSALYEYGDPRKGEHKDWGTHIFNYGRNEVCNFLMASGLFWLDKYHIDGLRVDAVASMLYLDYSRQPGEWVPNIYGGNENLEAIAFLKHFNEVCYQYYPGIMTIAEESTAFAGVSKPTYLGGLGFNLKWNMGWMHDTLRYISKDPIHRKYHHNDLTFGLLYAFYENFVLSISHDEVVHGKGSLLGKMPGDDWQQFANMRLYLGFMWTHPGKKLLFMGQDFGQWSEWSEARSLDWHLTQYERHHQLQRWVADLNRTLRSEPALYQHDFSVEGFEWIDANDWENSAISYLRYPDGRSEHLAVVCNFTPVPREGYRLGVPGSGFYRELLNSDSELYGGGNLGNAGGAHADPIPWMGQPHSIAITLPPLAICVFKSEG